MRLNESNGKVVATYALILGAMYFILGILEVVEGFGPLFGVAVGPVLGAEYIPADLFGGLATIVTGATYFGAAPLWKAKYESLSFLLVGVLLSTVFGALYLLILGANGLGAFLAGEEWEWMADLLRPEIWLFFLSLPLGYFALKVTRTRKEL